MNAAIQLFLLIVQLLCAGAIAGGLHSYLALNQLGSLLGWSIAIIGGLLIAFSFQFILIGCQFVVSRGSTARFIAKHGLHPSLGRIPKPGNVIRAWMDETLICIQNFSFRQPLGHWIKLPEPSPTAPRRPRPVLLVHGYSCNRNMWGPFAEVLAREGYRCGALTMEPAFGSIDQYAGPIAEAVQQLKSKTGAHQVDLIGHSMGGLAIRAYLRACLNNKASHHVNRVITLGTPHRGTLLAHIAPTTNGQQMRRDSPWLQGLFDHHQRELANLPAMTVIMTELDNIVFPALDQTLPGVENLVISDSGHLHLIKDPAVQQAVLERLAE